MQRAIDLYSRLKIAGRIHDLRIKGDYTQAEFAEIIDISVNFLSEIENAKKGLSMETLYKICTNLDVSADYILFGKTADVTYFDVDSLVEAAGHFSDKQLSTLIEYLTALQKLRACKAPTSNSDEA